MSMPENKPSTPPDSKKKALEALATIEIQERIKRRQEARSSNHSLLTILTPLWIWGIGLVLLPEATPVFAKALFHASCWGGFLGLAYSAWRRAQDVSPARSIRHRRELEEDIEKARRRREIRNS